MYLPETLHAAAELPFHHQHASRHDPSCFAIFLALVVGPWVVASAIVQVPGPVIAVGHSYGGAIITNAALPAGNVVGLVYVAAFAAFGEPNGIPAWRTLPSWAVAATGDKAAGSDVVRFMASEPKPRSWRSRAHT